MRALSHIEKPGTDWTGGSATKTFKIPETTPSPIVIRVKVYQDSTCLIDARFNKSVITVGRSTKSDIVLPDRHISRRHFHFYVEHRQLFVFVAPGKRSVLHEGKAVKAAVLDSGDMLKLSPYRLQVNISRAEASPQLRNELQYQIVFDGQVKGDHSVSRVAKKMKAALKLDGPQTAALFSGKTVVIKQDLDLKDALDFKKNLERMGAIVDVQAAIGSAASKVRQLNGKPVQAHQKQNKNITPGDISDAPDPEVREGEPGNGESVSQLVDNARTIIAPATPPIPAAVEPDDEEDDDEDDCEADFSLREKLSTRGEFRHHPQNRNLNADRVIELFRFREDRVIDARYLGRHENYYLESNRKRFRLIHTNGSNRSYWYFDDRFSGTVKSGDSDAIPISELQVDENLFRKRRRLYRLPLSDIDEIRLNDGSDDYLVRTVLPGLSPVVAEDRPPKKLNWKHGAISVMAHLLFLLVIAFLPLSPNKTMPEPETRFVKVDPNLMDQIQQKEKPVVKPPPPKPKETPPAVKPVQKKKPVKKKAVAKKKPPVRKKSKRVAKKSVKTSKKRASSKTGRKTGRSVASKHPKAGGGHGKGNTTNRNVKQVGLLAMLGDNTGGAVKTNVADVTNLDAVKSTNSGQAKFKVGGIKGKLGTSEISVTGGEVVSTKGNSQVLRSYGASGSGGVAAMEKGSVGQKQVKGMVRARLNKSVRIRGGMSREAVKRVIQQHLDEITYCYETALISNPSIKGKITMEWKIRMSGAVGEVRIKSSTIRSPEIYDCIKSAIRSWRFPKPVGNEVVVSYPFIFDVVGF